MEPLLEEEISQEDQRRIGLVAFIVLSDGIISHDQAFAFKPVYTGVNLFHSCEGQLCAMKEKSHLLKNLDCNQIEETIL